MRSSYARRLMLNAVPAWSGKPTCFVVLPHLSVRTRGLRISRPTCRTYIPGRRHDSRDTSELWHGLCRFDGMLTVCPWGSPYLRASSPRPRDFRVSTPPFYFLADLGFDQSTPSSGVGPFKASVCLALSLALPMTRSFPRRRHDTLLFVGSHYRPRRTDRALPGPRWESGLPRPNCQHAPG